MTDIHDYDQFEDNRNYKAISCEKIPELFLDKLVAKKHFSKYGRINRFILRPKRLSCTVEYESEDAAERAYLQAGSYNGQEFQVEYAEREVGHVQNTEEWVDPDVQAELEAMNPSQRVAMSQMHMRPIAAAGSSSPHLRHAAPAPTMPPPILTQRMPKPAPPPTFPKSTATRPAPEVPKVDASVRQELEALLRRPACTDEEKFRVLEARDKLIRLTTVRQTDIKTAKRTKGICPDMCPEKERLMREFQRQVSFFETSNDDRSSGQSSISHRRAIKEYSRSSADQEVPLAHELRSESVLRMTMQYLMQRIMDLCDDELVSLGDWYHFVWDRTRSIRKDITQQELCSLDAVELVEQCARFHIHCAARLVAEEPSVFDKKINAENLTKCLQTLKYMYHDLRLKDIPCPREIEFRCYIILLNLGDGHFLWELKQLPEYIQSSPEIKHSLEFYNALQNNNYVRFFNMVRSPKTSYLSSCILLGYFNKLRVRAMEVIVKSHNWRKNGVYLPLGYLTNVLGFEDQDAMAQFLHYHGLQCDENGVLLDRLKQPDLEYTMVRALQLIESKRGVSVGECICGRALDPPNQFEDHQPHSSFDLDGYLRPEAWNAEDQLRGEAADRKTLERLQQITEQKLQPRVTFGSPSFRGDSNIFKMPTASAPISPKQHQQQRIQQQQRAATPPPMIFGQFSDQNSSPKTDANARFGPPAPNPTTFDTGDEVDQSKSIFKIPFGSGMSGAGRNSNANTASPDDFFKNIFKSTSERQYEAPAAPSENIFNSGNRTSGGNIFGGTPAVAAQAAPMENIFQVKVQPHPNRNDNVFQHFGANLAAPKYDDDNTITSKSIFAAAATEARMGAIRAREKQEAEVKRRAHEAKRQRDLENQRRELEQERQRFEAELAEERRKLKEMREERDRIEVQKREERKQMLIREVNSKAEKELSRQLDILLSEKIYKIACEELRKYQNLDKISLQTLQTLLNECVADQTKYIARQEYRYMSHEHFLATKCFQRWQQFTKRQIQKRKLIQSIPVWMTTETSAQQAEKMRHPSEKENLKMMRRYRQGQGCDFKKLLSKIPSNGQNQVLNLCSLIAKNAPPATAKPGQLELQKYVKLIFSLPTETEELSGFENLCNKWLQRKLQPPSHQVESSEAFICGLEANVALCIRKFSGIQPVNEQGAKVTDECTGAHGIVCFMSCINYENTRKRLQSLLKLLGTNARVPVGFVVYNSQHDQMQLAKIMELESLADESKILSYKFCGCIERKNEFNFIGNLSRAVRFITRQCSQMPERREVLEMQTVVNWLEANLGDEMWQRWQKAALTNPAFGKVCSVPHHVIGIYNEAVTRLIKITCADLQSFPEFPTELEAFVPNMSINGPVGVEYFPRDWKHPSRQRDLERILNRMKLPPLHEDMSAITNVDNLEIWLLNYGSACVPNDDQKSTKASYYAIKSLIEQLNRPDLQCLDLQDRFGLVNYLPVIKAIAFAHVNFVVQHYSSDKVPNEVFYKLKSWTDYHVKPWWLRYQATEQVKVDMTQPCKSPTPKVIGKDDLEDVDKIIREAEETSRRVDETLSVRRKKPKQLSSRTLELQRELDESLRHFDRAKSLMTIDTNSLKMITSELDSQLRAEETQSTPTGRIHFEPGAVSAAGAFADATGSAGAGTTRVPGGDGDKGGHRALSAGSKKRKHGQTVTEMDAIIAKAMRLIKQVETRIDRKTT